MSRESIKNAVIDFLEQKSYKYLKPLGEGGFASVISVLSPQNEVVAVKIVEKKNVWIVEDQVWPWISHRNILPLLDVLSMDKPDVKLYITPMLPKALDETVNSYQFRSDLNGLTKLKLWMYDILLALSSLHSSGLCHCDLKTDNVLIDEEERAVLCDFSGLNHTEKPLENGCSPLIFRPPECFTPADCQNIQGVPYDMYTFGLMALNMLTGHWPQIELMKNEGENWAWSTHVLPILKKALQKPNFEYLMRRSLPHSQISEKDIQQALDFILSLLNIRPQERPSAKVILKHPFLKMGGNPFKSDKENDLLSSGDTNPFRRKDADMQLSCDQQVKTADLEVSKVRIKEEIGRANDASSYLQSGEETAVESRFEEVKTKPKARFPKAASRYSSTLAKRFANADNTDKYHPLQCLLENKTSERMSIKKSHNAKKSIKQKVTDWFRKKVKKYKKA